MKNIKKGIIIFKRLVGQPLTLKNSLKFFNTTLPISIINTKKKDLIKSNLTGCPLLFLVNKTLENLNTSCLKTKLIQFWNSTYYFLF